MLQVDLLIGDPKKAEETLGWVRQYSFEVHSPPQIALPLSLVAQMWHVRSQCIVIYLSIHLFSAI